MTRGPGGDRYILGISAYYHDSAAVLLRNGDIVAAAQEERFSRQKGDARFPQHAVDYCVRAAGIGVSDLEAVGFYDKPLLKFERILETYLGIAPRGFRSFLMAGPLWMRDKLYIDRQLRRELSYEGPVLYSEHHEAHAASAFLPSPFDNAAILTIDGVGEWATASIGRGEGRDFEIVQELHWPDSLGLLYSAFTYYLGFKVNSGEYKVMGLAPYGQPLYVDAIYRELIDLRDDGSFRLNQKYFNYLGGLTMTSAAFDELFGGPPRVPETPLTQREMDLARSSPGGLRRSHASHGAHGPSTDRRGRSVPRRRCGAELRRQRSPVARRSLQAHLDSARGRRCWRCTRRRTTHLAPSSCPATPRCCAATRCTARTLDRRTATMRSSSSSRQQERRIGVWLERIFPSVWRHYWPRRQVVGWFDGRMEFGPRALGARSILGDPRSPRMQAQMNLKIKFREGFRPFAPSVLRERVSDYFEMDVDSPYMLLVAPVREDRRLPITAEQQCALGNRPAQRPAVGSPGHHPRGLLGSNPDRLPGDQSALLRPDRGVRAAHRIRGARQHLVQRPR